MGINKKLKNAAAIWRKEGGRGILNHFKLLAFVNNEENRYKKWLEKHGTLNDRQRADITAEIAEMKTQPLLSIVVPVFARDDIWLKLCIDSVIRQIYGNWELCIGEDCSPSPTARPMLEEYAAKDSRIKVCFREQNGNISAASNSALDIATGIFTVLLDHDDELSDDALFWVAKEIELHPDASIIYSDEDMLDTKGRRSKPTFKPDWSPDLMYSLNMLNHLSAYRTDLLRDIGGFRLGAEGSQDYDIALRVIEHIPPEQIRHIPRILYHWRAIEGSVAFGFEEKPYAPERAREAIQAHFDRSGIKATVESTAMYRHRVRYAIPDSQPSITVFLLQENGFPVIQAEMLKAATAYSSAEFVSLSLADNIARNINAVVAKSNSTIVCFLRNAAEPQDDGWLAEMASFAVQPGIGAVGGKLLGQNLAVVDGGLVIGTGGLVNAAHAEFPNNFPGNVSRNHVICNYSAVSLSCMAMRREVFMAAGGFDDQNVSSEFIDVDLCLRLRENGYRIVFNPYVKLTRLANVLKKGPSPADVNYFRTRWKKYVENDPFYNKNLSKTDASFSVNI